jgi:hypothetical protein
VIYEDSKPLYRHTFACIVVIFFLNSWNCFFTKLGMSAVPMEIIPTWLHKFVTCSSNMAAMRTSDASSSRPIEGTGLFFRPSLLLVLVVITITTTTTTTT